MKEAGEVTLKRSEVVDDPELVNYLIDLKTNVLNCYSTVVTGTKEASMQAVLLEAIPDIFSFMQSSLSDLSQGLVSHE